MLNFPNIKTLGFSYEEVEDIMYEWNPKSKSEYSGCVVRAETDEDVYDFAYILSKVRPELGISPNAISIYLDCGYIYPRKGVDVIVVDGIQDSLGAVNAANV